MAASAIINSVALGASIGGIVGISGGFSAARIMDADFEQALLLGGAAGCWGMATGGAAAGGGAVGVMKVASAATKEIESLHRRQWISLHAD